MILSNLSPEGLIGIYPYIFMEVMVFNAFENKYLDAFLPDTIPNTTQSNKELPTFIFFKIKNIIYNNMDEIFLIKICTS